MNRTVDTANSDAKLVAPDGSALYYALLYVEPQSSTRALETLQFIQTLSTTLNDVTEGDVAEKKIHWWHEELTRLSQQQPRHPACIAVKPYLHSNKSIEASLSILSAAATERYTPFATEQTLNETILADYRARLSLLETAMNTLPDTKTQTNVRLGDKPINFHAKSELPTNNKETSITSKNDLIALGLGRFERLHYLAKRLRSGYPVFSDERYKQYGLTPDDLLNHRAQISTQTAQIQPKVRALLACTVDETVGCIENAVACLAEQPISKPANLTVQILCQVRHAQLKLWKKRKPNLINESIALTPLRKFIIAYRCKRRFEPN